MSQNQAKVRQNSKAKENYQEQICELENKLIRYDEIITEKDELHSQINDFKLWIENTELKEERIRKNLLNDLDTQTKKLRKSEECQVILKTENKGLLSEIGSKDEQICTLKQKEQSLRNEADDLKKNKKQIENDLRKAKDQIEEKKCTIEGLTKSLKCKEEEYQNVRRQLDECRAALCRQNEICKDLEKELECTSNKLRDAKFQFTLIEQKMKLELDTLSNELEINCQRLRTVQIEYDEARQIIDEENSNVRKLENQVANLREINEKDRCEANTQIQRLKKDISAMDENACRIKSKFSELTRENKCISSENYKLRTQLRGKRILLEKMKQVVELSERTKNNQITQLEQEKNALECDVQQKKKEIEELEQEMCLLREKNKKLELNNCFKANKRKMYCLKNKLKKLESKYSENNCCPPTKCEFNCSRDHQNCKEPDDCKEFESNTNCCPFNHSKCPSATKTCKDDCVENSNLKQMKSEEMQIQMEKN